MKALLYVFETSVASIDALSPAGPRRLIFIGAPQQRRMTFVPQPTSSTSSHGMVAGEAAAYEQEM